MVGFQGYRGLTLGLLLLAGLTATAAAQEDTGLYERPVLVLEPGMHTASIRRADVDASGTYGVTGSHDRTVRVWSLAGGALLRTIRVPRGPGNVGKVYAVAMSPDGEFVAAGGWTDGTNGRDQIYLYQRATGALIRRLDGLPNVVFHLVFSADGRFLAATLGSGGLRVYEHEADWREVARDADYGGPSYGAAFSADGRLATTSLDGHVRLYDREFRRVAMVPTTAGNRPYSVAFSPAGDRLAVGFDDSTVVSVFDGHDLSMLTGPHTQGIDNGDLGTVAWSADGEVLYAGGRYNRGGPNPVVAWSDAGTGSRREFEAGVDTVMSVKPLPDGGILVASQDPYLGVFNADGTPRWQHKPGQADLRGQRFTLAVSPDGSVVDFGYEEWADVPARFDLAGLALTLAPAYDERTVTPEQDTIDVENWMNNYRPTLNGAPLRLRRFEMSRSLAIHPDGARFVLGADWNLRAFDASGDELWRLAAPGVVWAVNITGDGRLVVAAYGDGTIRWHQMDDGQELLAFFPLADRKNWVAWTPEGIHAATPGAQGVLRWHVNHGWDVPAEVIRAHEIEETNRPDVIRLVVQEMGTHDALAVAELAKIRRAIQRRTGVAVAPGARLHLLSVGVSDYGDAARHLRLRFADDDANDVAAALLTQTKTSLYADVVPQLLYDQDANRLSILRALKAMQTAMAKSEPGRDLAVVHFSGHGTVVDGEFYLLPHGVDVSDPVILSETALSATRLHKELQHLGQYGRVLVFLDACRAGGATADGRAYATDAARLSAVLVGANVTVLTSSGADQASREDDAWRNGAFTEALLEALGSRGDANGNGLISVSELTAYLTRHVRRLTAGGQTPAVEVRFTGDVFVAGL